SPAHADLLRAFAGVLEDAVLLRFRVRERRPRAPRALDRGELGDARIRPPTRDRGDRRPMTTTMAKRFLPMDQRLYRYILDHSSREAAVLAELREETAKLPQAGMQIGPDQGQYMALLARLTGAKRCIEIGVFTGYSSLAVALALPADGRIVACDISDE